jgi:hypothetical protein
MSALLYKFPFEPCVISSVLFDVLEFIIVRVVHQNAILFVLVRHSLEIIIMTINLVYIVVLIVTLRNGLGLLGERLLLVLGNVSTH